MKIYVLVVTLILSCAAALAQDAKPATPAAPVEVAAEPSHHLKIENEYIRAYYAEVAPQQSTLMHHHGTDYVGVSFGANEIDSTTPDGKVKHLVFEDGQVTYTPAGVVHTFTDRASTPFRNATIELLQNQGHPVCVKNCENDPRAKDWPTLQDAEKAIGYGDSFRIIAVDIKPQQTVSIAGAAPQVVMPLGDMEGRISAPGQPPQERSHPAHQIMFHPPYPAGTTLTNIGAQDIRLVEIQFKPSKQ